MPELQKLATKTGRTEASYNSQARLRNLVIPSPNAAKTAVEEELDLVAVR